MENDKKERAIDRLAIFCSWCISNGLTKSTRDFELQCGIGTGYLRNSSLPKSKGTIGSELLASIKRVFPMLNLDWIILGEGNMLTNAPIGGYIARYKKLEEAFQEISKIVNKIK